MCSHRSPRGDRRCSKEESIPLFVLFVLFGQAKRTLKEKNHKETFPLSYFCVTKSSKSHQRERSPLFENSSPVSATPTNALRAWFIPPVSATPTNALRALVNSPCLGDADTHAPRMCQFPQCKTRLPWRQAGFIIIRDIPLPEVYPLSALSICG